MRYLSYLILSLPTVGAYAIFAVGIVVIYRASRVLNLAHGAIAMVSAYLTLSPVKFSLVQLGIPLIPALLLGVLIGAALGVVVERVFVRGLRHMSLTAQTVGTVAVLSLFMSVAAKYWGTAPQTTRSVFPKGAIHVGGGLLQYGGIGLFLVAVVLAFAMLALFKFTNLGLAMRGAAVNRRAASLMGINPDRTTAIAWAIGGGLAAISGILLAAITNLEPYQLSLQVLPAFVAALLGGLESLAAALGGAVIVGLLLGMVPAFASVPGLNIIAAQTGAPELVLTVLALAVMYIRGQRFSVATRDDGGFATRGAPRKRRGSLPAPVMIVLGIALVAWVWMPGVPFSLLSNAYLALVYALIAISLVVLTGWVGQISLGHAALVGIGAFATGVLSRSLGIPFPFNLPIAAAVSALAATMLGAVALRVRGLYLAVATLIFSWMADSFLFRSSWFVGAGGTSTIKNAVFGSPDGFPNFDLSDQKILYFFALAVAIGGLLAMANLRTSKTGRAFFATRGSEMAAASLGINVMRYKLLAFALSGMLAGAAGNLYIIKLRTVAPGQFTFTASLLYLSIAVVGGLQSLGWMVFAGALFAALNELFYRVAALQGYLEVTSAVLLVGALLVQAHRDKIAAFFRVLRKILGKVLRPVRKLLAKALRPVGKIITPVVRPAVWALLAVVSRSQRVFEAATNRVRRVLPSRRGRLRDELVVGSAQPVLALASNGNGNGSSRHTSSEPAEPIRATAPVILEGAGVTVRFGGLIAVNDATIEIHKGEIVGLIGPNGAGKTTLFNALSGLNEPTSGVIRLFDKDVSSLPVHERARLGIGRTFQVIQLFNDLSVRDNLLVATHVHNPTGVVSHMLAMDRAVRAERDAHKRVERVVELLDLTEIVDRPVSGLPFGVLRLVEIARAVVTEAPIILLDEATSGLDNAETDRLSGFLRSLRDELGISMLLIEHDVQMVSRLTDYMYVLNMGRMISEGTPAQVTRDPEVVAAYLGEPATVPAGA